MTLNTSPKTRGEPSIESLASGLGTLGRYGDSYMVHAAEGETIVPREILEANPGLREDLFRQMQMAGIENPNRYVVGDQLNSINPVTGQPEFFFKKLWRKVKKVVKRFAPMAAMIVGNMLLPGIGGIIASGLMTKAQGGSWGDALKSAAVSYVGQGIMSGLGSASSGNGFMKGLGEGFSDPVEAAGNLFSSGPSNPWSQGVVGGTAGISNAPGASLNQQLVRHYDPNALSSGEYLTVDGAAISPAAVKQMTADRMAEAANSASSPSSIEPMKTAQTNQLLDSHVRNRNTFNTPDDMGRAWSMESTTPPLSAAERALESRGLVIPRELNNRGLGKLGIDPKNTLEQQALDNPIKYDLHSTAGDAGGAADAAITDRGMLGNAFRDYVQRPAQEILEPLVGKEWAETAAPLAGGTALLGAVSYASGAWDDEPPPPPTAPALEQEAYRKWQKLSETEKNSVTGQNLYWAWNASGPFATREQFERRTGGPSSKPDWYFLDAAGGGEVMGPGSGTSDSIPARLSDGEFVMTARAVKNAGGGNRSLGAARMYDMMNRFEQGAA